LPTTSQYATWARVLGSEFETLSKETAADQPTLIDKYGATEPAEFFAVVTEYFFEKSLQLKQRHPELYEELRRFYRQDPASTDGVETQTRHA
jgi:Mlc titration factor MtfA (ptsG expression regulator)